MSARPTHNRRSARRSVELRPRVSKDLKTRVEAAAAAERMTVNRWMERLLEVAAPPLLDVDGTVSTATPDSTPEDVRMAS
jgi:hypothetical protein